MKKVNGVILTGGNQDLISESDVLTDFCKKAKVVLEQVKELNKQGIHIPLWAVCQGFQCVAISEAPYYEIFGKNQFDACDYNINLIFQRPAETTRMHAGISQKLQFEAQNNRISYDTHHDGVYPPLFNKYKELKEYQVVATAKDRKGVEFIAAYEHKLYPIYCVQFHPEKSPYVWSDHLDIPRYQASLDLATHYAKMFVSEARKNNNTLGKYEEQLKHLICNHPVICTYRNTHDVYAFKN